MTTSKEKQRYFTNYFYESLYKEKEYKLRIAQNCMYDEYTEVYFGSNDNRGGEIRIDPYFRFISKDLIKIAIEAGVDHFAFDNIGGAKQGTKMAAEIGVYNFEQIYVPKFSLYDPPVQVNEQNYIEARDSEITYKILQESDIHETFLHHKYFMEVVGFKYIEMMKTPEGIDKIYNDIMVRVDDNYILSPKGRDSLLSHFSPPLRVIYSLISAKLVSDERYRAVLERHKMLRYENDLIVEYFEKIVKYFG